MKALKILGIVLVLGAIVALSIPRGEGGKKRGKGPKVYVEVVQRGELSRLMLFVKWFLIIPHVVVMSSLSYGLLFATFLAWWAILFTGRYPRGRFDLVVGIQQWNVRVAAYSSLLATDRYPPFSFDRPISGGATFVVVFGVLVWMSVMALSIVGIAVAVMSVLAIQQMATGPFA